MLCSPWNYTSWIKYFKPDSVLYECTFSQRSIENISGWRAGKRDHTKQQLGYVWSSSICPDDTSSKRSNTPTKGAIDSDTIAVATSVLVGILLLLQEAEDEANRETTCENRRECALWTLLHSWGGKDWSRKFLCRRPKSLLSFLILIIICTRNRVW